MDTRLFKRYEERGPKFNQVITRGLACKDIPDAKAYIDRIIRCAEQQYPEGLVYEGSRRCNPVEEYNQVTAISKGSKRVFDLAPSSVYLVRYDFSYKGEPLYPQYLYLPYVEEGGTIDIMGKKFMISPVLADKVFSVGTDNVFIPMPRGKVTFYEENSYYRQGAFDPNDPLDGHTGVRRVKAVVWSELHNRGGGKNKNSRSNTIHLGRVRSTLMHYLLCKFGFDETFRMYGHADVKVMPQEEATLANYPADDWVVCRSAKIKPSGVRMRADAYNQVASSLALVIRKNQFTPLVESMVTGFFYVVDHFPDLMKPEYVHIDIQWQILMGFILFGDEPSEGKLMEDVQTHLKSLDGYVDFEVQKTLREEDIECRHIYDLFVYIIDNMSNMLHESSNKISSMYDKQLMVLRYVLSDINNAMFEFLFKITNNNKKQMTKEELNKILADYFKTKLILRISSGKGHGEISSVASPSDNMFFKLTSVIIQQSDTAGKGKGRETKPIDPSMYLDASIAEVGGYCVLPKSSPIGKDRINPFVHLGELNRIERNPKFIELLDSVQREIER